MNKDKLYKRDVFDGMRFMPGVTYEDKRLIHHVLDKAKKIVYLNSFGYTYYISDDGITSTRSFKTANGDYGVAIRTLLGRLIAPLSHWRISVRYSADCGQSRKLPCISRI